MIRLKLTTYIIFISFSFGFGQNFIQYLNQANEAEYLLVEKKDFKKAASIFSNLEKKYNRFLFKDYFYQSIAMYLSNDSINGYKYMIKFMELYGSPESFIPAYKARFPKLYISDHSLAKFKSMFEEKISLLQDTIVFNKAYKPTIDSLSKYQEMDQMNRRNPNGIDQNLDKNLQLQYLSYLKRFGIPNVPILGDTYIEILFHVSDKNIMELYKDFFYEKIKEGLASPYTYAIVVDRMLTDDTVFGSYNLKFSTKTSKQKVAENRKKIGMSPYYEGTGTFPLTFWMAEK